MKVKLIIVLGLLALGWVIFGLAGPAAASPLAQSAYYTPTARPDGRIIYIVKEGDSCISISLLNRIPEATLRSLNNIRGSDCLIRAGQELLLGLSGPVVSATAGPSATPTSLLPSPTPLPGSGEICVVLYDDVNGNGIAETGEKMLAGGQVSVSDRQGKFSRTGTTIIPATEEDKPLCFETVPEGDYNVSVAVPQGYNPTTNTNYPLILRAGDISTLDFGAQVSLRAAPPEVATETRSPLLGILGGAMVLAGVGLALYLRRTSK